MLPQNDINISGEELDDHDHIEKYLNFKEILEAHRTWLSSGGKAGQKAILRQADLSGLSLFQHDLRFADFHRANLQSADLKEANLYGTRLEEANLQDADLTGAKGLLASQLAGANVSGAKLPEDIDKFEGLNYVAEASQHARKLFFYMLLACVYCWLTFATIKDAALLTNTASSTLPIIGTPIPIVGFYWAAPMLILCIYLYFHLYLQRLWEALVELPAIFPDGKPLPQTAYPWLLNGFVWAYFYRLKTIRPHLSRLQNFLFIILAWWLVPLTLFFFWLRYLPAHDWTTTSLHIGLVVLGIVASIAFSWLTRSTLLLQEKRPYSWKKKLQDARTFKCGGLVLGIGFTGVVFYFLSLGAIEGERLVHPSALIDLTGGHLSYSQYGGVKDLNYSGIRIFIPKAMEVFGHSPFANLVDAELSIKPPHWTSGVEEEIASVKGASLREKNLRHANATRVFLARANLTAANLKCAYLYQANLVEAILERANLDQAYLSEANLVAAKLRGANLSRAKLFRANLLWADLRGTDLSEANLREANLGKADLHKANLRGMDLSGVIGLTREQVQSAAIDENTKLPDYLKGITPSK